MPELPEVETVCKGLQNLINKKVNKVFRSDKNLRIQSSLDLKLIIGAKITKINRRARYIIIDFDNSQSMIVHLGMSGKVTMGEKFDKLKHDHFACEFDDKSWLVFNDTRRFGFVDLLLTKDLKNHKMLNKLGPEPLSDEFNFAYLKDKLKKKSMNIKTAMMDNAIVVGVGNIYINESLFEAKISPLRAANKIKDSELQNLIAVIKKTIKKAIELGGSSISDYVDSKGDLGYFQNTLQVYGRYKSKNEHEKCFVCNDNINVIKQNGRSSFYCNSCQK